MVKASQGFQVFVKPTGSLCNLGCQYCYYLEKEQLYSEETQLQMPPETLERYIIQHIEASPDDVITFSWHGGEPTLLGVDYFRKVVELQHRHQPPGQHITNGIQTNGTLLDKNWCRFLADAGFGVGLSLDGPKDLHDRYRLTKHRRPTHELAMRGYNLLRQHRIPMDILCVVHSHNVRFPIQVYTFFKQIGAQYLTFLPLVEHQPVADPGADRRSVTPDEWGTFLCNIFDMYS